MTKIIVCLKQRHFPEKLANAILRYQKINTMIVTIFLLSVSLLVGLVFLVAYIWSVRSGQFDDDFGPAHRIFFDDDLQQSKTKKAK